MKLTAPRLLLSVWPRTLSGQLIVVTVLAILLSNAMVVGWFTLGHQRDNDQAASQRLMDRAAATAILMSRIPPQTRETALRALSNDFWGMFDLRHDIGLPVAMSASESALCAHLVNLLPPDLAKRSVQVHFSPTIASPRPPMRGPPPKDGTFSPDGSHDDRPSLFHDPGPPPHPIMTPGRKRVMEVIIPISDDTQLVALFFRPQGPFWSGQLLLAAMVTILFASLAGALIAQRISRPLSLLADAAKVVSRGGAAPHVPEDGPEDIRRAVSAFNDMTDQVSRTMASQRHLLSAVGHDLRTPITAMRINIEFVRDAELADRLTKNVDELQAMTEAVLSAARGTGGESFRQIDLSALVESLCADLDDMNIPVHWKGGVSAPISCRSNELRRAIRNLIENAVSYGTEAEVSVVMNENHWVVRIADLGPGIPQSDRTRVFDPFVRLESSRNATTGGLGLGMTLARTIVEGHRGRIDLAMREDGPGFLVSVVLPSLPRNSSE